MGNGWCKDHRYDYYDYIRYSVSDLSACSSICFIDNGFKGYSTYNNDYCYCWYSNNQLPTVDDTSILIYDGFSGEGTITQIEETSDSLSCYRFDPI